MYKMYTLEDDAVIEEEVVLEDEGSIKNESESLLDSLHVRKKTETLDRG